MLLAGSIDIAFVCGLPYVLMKDEHPEQIELLAAPVMKAAKYKNKPVYFSDIIVRKDSPYKTIADLRDKTFTFNEEISNSGYNAPRHFFLTKGYSEGFRGNVVRSGSHEESIRMVASGEADYYHLLLTLKLV